MILEKQVEERNEDGDEPGEEGIDPKHQHNRAKGGQQQRYNAEQRSGDVPTELANFINDQGQNIALSALVIEAQRQCL